MNIRSDLTTVSPGVSVLNENDSFFRLFVTFGGSTSVRSRLPKSPIKEKSLIVGKVEVTVMD